MVGAKSAALGLPLGLFMAVGIGAQPNTYYWNPSLAGGGQIERTVNWSSQPDGGGTRPPSSRDDAFDTLNTSVWNWIDSVPAGQPASSRSANGKLTLTAAGNDVFINHNEMAALYRSDITGAFDVTVKIESQTRPDPYSKAGIMVWNDFKDFRAGGGFAVEIMSEHGFAVHYDSTEAPDGQPNSRGRLDAGGPYPLAAAPTPCWLRLVKRQNAAGEWVFTGYYRTEATQPWTKIRGDYRPLRTAANSQVGLFVTSHNPTVASTAVFDDFEGGSHLQAAHYNLSFNGTGPSADQNVVIGDNVMAASIDFTGYTGSLSFGGWNLTVAGDLRFTSSMSGIHPNTGRLILNGASGVQNLYPRPGDTLPVIHKTAASEVVVQGAPLLADSLYISAGLFDLNSQNAHFQQLTASGGTLEGLTAATDTLFIHGRADFSALGALAPGPGIIAVKSTGNGKTVAFDPGGKSFPNLMLWMVPTGPLGANIRVGPGDLVVSGNLVFRNQRAPRAFDDTTDFLTHGPDVTVGGSISQIIEGTGDNWHPIRMGGGTWSVGGNTAFSLYGGSAGTGVLNLTGGSGTLQTLAVTEGPLATVAHAAAGTVQQAIALSAGSLSLTGGTWNANGQDLGLSGDLVVDGPAGTLTGLGGSDLVVQGTAAFTGRPGSRLNLAPATAWTVKVSGAFTADHVDVANSNASGGTAGAAGSNSADQGKNVNWTFNGVPATFTPAIGTEPADITVVEGADAAFTVAATGNSLAYRWRRVGDTAVLGTSATLTLPSVALAQNGSLYQCLLSNSTGTATTRQARLTVTRRPVPASVVQEPVDVLVEAGKGAAFSLTAAGDPTLAYAWRRKGDTAVLSRTATLTLAAVALALDDSYYRCIVSNAHGADTSREAKLDVVPQPVPARITREPRDSTVYVTGKVSFSVAAEGSEPLAFAWRKVGDTAVLSTEPVLAFASAALGQDNSVYRCVVTNGYGADTSAPARLRVLPPPVAPRIVREPSDTLVKAGGKARFSAGVLGSAPLKYEWRRRGSDAVLSTDSLFVIDTVRENMSGNSYYVIVSNTEDKDTSAEARLTVRVCDSLSISLARDTAVDEGKPVSVWGKAVCADRFEWSVVSGPAPRLLDPGVDTLTLRAPRVKADTALLYRFTAYLGEETRTKDVRVGVREAIPDPDMALPADLIWSGEKPLVLRPAVFNQARLSLFTGYPLRYAWSLEPLGADTACAGDSLTLRDPLGEGPLSAVLCMDNGGDADCDTVRVTVGAVPTALVPGLALPGGLRLQGSRLLWTAAGTVRLWDWRGRRLFEARGRAGDAREMPRDALRALLARRARLSFRP